MNRGYWSSEATSLFNTTSARDPVADRELSVFSPDHKRLVHVHHQKVDAVVEGKEFATDLWNKTAAELGWAPDSSRFFLTWTEGGNMGDWHVAVYDVSGAGARQIKGIEKRPIADFEKYIRSLPPDPQLDRFWWDNGRYCYSNVVAAQWLNGSRELLLSVLVEPEGDCRYSGDFMVYRVAIPSGRILQRYTAGEAHRKFNRDNLPQITR